MNILYEISATVKKLKRSDLHLREYKQGRIDHPSLLFAFGHDS